MQSIYIYQYNTTQPDETEYNLALYTTNDVFFGRVFKWTGRIVEEFHGNVLSVAIFDLFW